LFKIFTLKKQEWAESKSAESF